MATLVPQPIEFADTAPITIERAAEVAGSRAEVWTVLCDHERWPEWFGPSLSSVRPTSDPAGGVVLEGICGRGESGRRLTRNVANFHDLFANAIEGFEEAALAQRQQDALRTVGLASGPE